jgi:L-malate glycosyltransferase
VKRFPDATFEVAGEGKERGALLQQAARLGMGDRLVLRGAIADIPAFLSGVDLAVLSSRAEGMSNAVLEYMASGRGIVASDVGACRRLLEGLPVGGVGAATRGGGV